MTTNKQFQEEKYFQHTLKDSITCVGRGLHTGLQVVMTIMPADANTGYTFVRRDLDPSRSEISARWHNVTDTRLSTTITNNRGSRVSTVEHLLAALYACNIDNARIVLDAPEVPIMDGSSRPYVQLIEQIGRQRQDAQRRAIVIKKPLHVREGEKEAGFHPHPQATVDMEIHFDDSAIGKQRFVTPISAEIFANDLAAARTFGFESQVNSLRQLGLAQGGSLQNAVLIKDSKVVNPEGLRFSNEFVRHKALDAIGDLSLAGVPIIGRFEGKSSGHYLNNILLRELMANEEHWAYTSLEEAEKNWRDIIETDLDFLNRMRHGVERQWSQKRP